MDAPGVTDRAIPLRCKKCGGIVNFWLNRSAQPLLARLLGTAPPAVVIGTVHHHRAGCGATSEITIGDLRSAA